MADEPLAQGARAVASGDAALLTQLLTEDPSVMTARDNDGHTLLGLACHAATSNIALPAVAGTPEHHAVVDTLLAAGADPSAAANNGWTPLHTAAMTGHVDLIRRLLAAGAKREGQLYGTTGGSPLALGLFYAQRANLALLAETPVPDNLRTAAALNRSIERFFDAESLTAQASAGTDFYRPLLVFPEWERTNTRQELLDEALSWAARNDACDAMVALVNKGANVNSNAYRGTPLLWAIYADRVDAATWLLDRGADPNLRHDFGGGAHGTAATAMHLAAQYSCLKCLRLLLARGADPTILDGAYNATPLGWAQHEGSAEAVAILSATEGAA